MLLVVNAGSSSLKLAVFDRDLTRTTQARLERIKGWRLNWEPGSRYEYHPTAAHWVMVEIITNRTGLDFRMRF